MASLNPPQGHREPPTPAELRAYKRWQHMDGARALIVHDMHGALALRPDEKTQDHPQIQTDSALRQTLQAGEWSRRQMMDHAENTLSVADRTQRDALALMHKAQQIAEMTQQAILNTADRTARTHLLLAMETLAVALSLAASAYLLIDGGQRLGLAYGIAAYHAWVTPAHGARNAHD